MSDSHDLSPGRIYESTGTGFRVVVMLEVPYYRVSKNAWIESVVYRASEEPDRVFSRSVKNFLKNFRPVG